MSSSYSISPLDRLRHRQQPDKRLYRCSRQRYYGQFLFCGGAALFFTKQEFCRDYNRIAATPTRSRCCGRKRCSNTSFAAAKYPQEVLGDERLLPHCAPLLASCRRANYRPNSARRFADANATTETFPACAKRILPVREAQLSCAKRNFKNNRRCLVRISFLTLRVFAIIFS